jgi:hypothetical protein
MSKNFRSSFIDLLCCRYSKRSLFGPNDSLRGRRATDNYGNNFNAKFRKSDYLIRASVVSGISQSNPMPGTSQTGGGTTFTSSSRLTSELLPKYEEEELNNNNNNNNENENHSSCHITVGTQTNTLEKSHRRRKHGDRSPVIVYSSLTPQSTRKNLVALCT